MNSSFLARESLARENTFDDTPFTLNTKRLISKKDYAVGSMLGLAFTVLPIGLGMALSTDREPNKVNGLGVLLVLTGLTLGPSAIQAYNGYGGHALAAAALRFAGEALVVAFLIANMSNAPCDIGNEGNCGGGSPWPGMWVGSVVYASGVAYSLIQPALHIRRGHTSTDLPLHLLPRLAISPQGHAQYGLVAGLSF